MQHLTYSFWNTKEPRKTNDLKNCDLITLNILPNNFFHNQNTYSFQTGRVGYDFGTALTQPTDEYTLLHTAVCPHLFR